MPLRGNRHRDLFRIIGGYVKKLKAAISIFFNVLKPERVETLFKWYDIRLNLTTPVTSVITYQQVVSKRKLSPPAGI